MALTNLAKIIAKQVRLGNKKFKDITPKTFQVEVYEILEDMVKVGEMTEEELNNLLAEEE